VLAPNTAWPRVRRPPLGSHFCHYNKNLREQLKKRKDLFFGSCFQNFHYRPVVRQNLGPTRKNMWQSKVTHLMVARKQRLRKRARTKDPWNTPAMTYFLPVGPTSGSFPHLPRMPSNYESLIDEFIDEVMIQISASGSTS
jgi:hypothetical protein